MDQSMLSRLYIAGIGMVTPVGFDFASTVAAVEAGINRFQESEYIGKSMKPFTMALIPGDVLPRISYKLNQVEDSTLQMGIMLQASDIALNQIEPLKAMGGPLPLFLACPESYPDQVSTVSPRFIEYLIKQTDANIDASASRMIGTGRAGVIDAIDLAFKYLQQVEGDFVLVGGADSYQEEALLAYLDKDDRIAAEEILNGFIPGEAAGFLLLTRNRQNAMIWDGGVISLNQPGIEAEKGHMYSETPYLGDGLAAAIKKSLDDHRGEKISTVYSSMNGEQFWSKELGVALLRNKDSMNEDYTFEHPADCLGDIGAASGVALIGLASAHLARSGSPASHLVYCSSDQEYRGAICVNYEKLS